MTDFANCSILRCPRCGEKWIPEDGGPNCDCYVDPEEEETDELIECIEDICRIGGLRI